MRRWIGLAALLVVGLGALVGLTARFGDSAVPDGAKSSGAGGGESAALHDRAVALGAPSGGPVSRDTAAAAEVAADRAVSEAAAPGSSGSSAVPGLDDRVVRTATLELRVARKRLAGGPDRIDAVVAGLGGYTENSDISTRTISMTVRVPAAAYDEAMRRLGALGRVTGRTERGDDVSAQMVDLDARIRNLSSQEAVLQGIMDDATTITDTITIQQQLFSVREQIEQLQGQRQFLDRQVGFATISVAMVPRGAVVAAPEPRGTIAGAWDDAWDVAVAIVGGTIVVLGAAIPLGLLALLGLVVWRLVRRDAGLAPTS